MSICSCTAQQLCCSISTISVCFKQGKMRIWHTNVHLTETNWQCKCLHQVFHCTGFGKYWLWHKQHCADLPGYDHMIPPNNLAIIFNFLHSKECLYLEERKAHCVQFDQCHFSEREVFFLCVIKRFQIETWNRFPALCVYFLSCNCSNVLTHL